MGNSSPADSFRGLLLRHRGRTGLRQSDLAARAGVSRRSVQDWESGLNYPTAERLQALIRALLEAGGLTAGRESSEAREFWDAAERESPRMHTPFDEEWFARLRAAHLTPTPGPARDALRAVPAVELGTGGVNRAQDWGTAPDATDFVGRNEELAQLRRWVLDERCRLAAILGMGGIGKTSLAARLAEEVVPSFDRVYWRSLRDAPPLTDWLAGAIGFLSDQQIVPPVAESERLAALLQLLRERRSLLVLDNSETLFEPGQREGRYREGMAGYGHLLQTVGEARHQSCLVLTGREAPPELAMLGAAVRTMELSGLGTEEAQVLLAAKHLDGTSQQWAELNTRFGGNGLALKVVGESIRELFGGEIRAFLEEADASSMLGGIRRLLTEQVERSSTLEQQVLRVLAVEREPLSLAALLAALSPRVGRGTALEAVEALRRRSLVERAETPGAAAFTLQSVVLEYVTDRLAEDVAEEIERGHPVLLVEQPLIKAQAKDYVRQTQERLIGAPILQRLRALHGEEGAAQRVVALLEGWRGRPPAKQGYGPGNAVNLLRLLRGDLRGLDFSRLALRQAYLVQVDAQGARLVDAHLAETVLAEAFDFPGSVALSGDGALLAAGTSTGQIWLWRVADRTALWAVQGHAGGVWGVAVSDDGRLLASGSADGTVKLWEVGIAEPVVTLQGHTGTVWDVALSADGQLVASGGEEGSVRLWDTRVGRPLATLQGHIGTVYSVALSANGRLLASGGEDGTVRLWDTGTGQPLATLQGHTGEVRGVALSANGRLLASGGGEGTVRLWETAFAGGAAAEVDDERTEDVGGSPATPPSRWQPLATLQGQTGVAFSLALSADGQLLASGSAEGMVRLWETGTGRPVATLQGHTGPVWGVALSGDGQLVASGGGEGTVRLWETGTRRPVATLQGHTGAVWGVALSADGQLLASGSAEGTVRLWETRTGRLLCTLEGQTGMAFSVALSADGQLVASSDGEGTVRLWETRTGRPVATLQAHTGAVWRVALSADGRLLASGGGDGTVRLWETGTERPLTTLRGHTATVYSVTLSADGRLLASGGGEGAVRLWETGTGRPVATLQGDKGAVWHVALSADGHRLVSSGADGTVRLWETATGRLLATLQGHTSAVSGVALSADGQLLASGGADGTVRLWETATGRPVGTLQGHTAAVWGVALSADGQLVASGGFDGTVRLWEASTGTFLRILRPERRYERLDITGLTGITSAQRAALLALGAIEQYAPASEPTARLPLERVC